MTMTKRNQNRKRNRSSRGKEGAGSSAGLWARETFKTVLLAVIITTVVHLFLFQPFVVPTPSMATTVEPGDYIVVSKLHYGPRTPRSIGIPFLKLYVPGVQLPSVELPGFSDIERGDVIVFHLPTEDGPIDEKENYLKRVVGMPGDELEVRDKQLLIGGAPIEATETMQQLYSVQTKHPGVTPAGMHLDELGVVETYPTNVPGTFLVDATPAAAVRLAELPEVEKVEPYITPGVQGNQKLFPINRDYTPDNYGPITIPKRGDVVTLNAESWPLYEKLIRDYEGHDARLRNDGTVEIDGVPADRYTIEQDYFFMMGDNRDNSLDSRYWGFVPHDHIVGKAVMTFFSWDSARNAPRLARTFQGID